MENTGDEPPDRGQISTLEARVYDPRKFFSENGKYTIDKREIFLEKRNETEIGILNMTYAENKDLPLLAYRVRLKGDGKETSDIIAGGIRAKL